MYVYLNAFNYEELIEELVERLGLQDEPLTYEVLLKAFQSVSARLKQRSELTKATSLGNFGIIIKLAKTYLELKHTTTLFSNESEADKLVEIFTNIKPLSVPEGWDLFNHASLLYPEVGNYKDGYYLDIDFDQAYILASEILDYINAGELESEDILEHFLEEVLWEQFLDVDSNNYLSLEVLDKPGKIVKYGNSLITFPILLAKVDSYEFS